MPTVEKGSREQADQEVAKSDGFVILCRYKNDDNLSGSVLMVEVDDKEALEMLKDAAAGLVHGTVKSIEEMYRHFATSTQSTVRLNPALVELGFICGVISANGNMSPFLLPSSDVVEYLNSPIDIVSTKIRKLSVQAVEHEMRRMSAEDVKRIEEGIRKAMDELYAAAVREQATAPDAPKGGVTGDGSI